MLLPKTNLGQWGRARNKSVSIEVVAPLTMVLEAGDHMGTKECQALRGAP